MCGEAGGQLSALSKESIPGQGCARLPQKSGTDKGGIQVTPLISLAPHMGQVS